MLSNGARLTRLKPNGKELVFQGLATLKRDGPIATINKGIVFLKHNKRKEVMPLPDFLQIEITTACNFKCITCSRESLPDSRLNKSVSIETIGKLLDDLPELKVVKLQGLGEPLMSPNIVEVIDFIRLKNKRISIVTVTNGSLLTFEKYREIALKFDEVRVSFDSTRAENFENIRRGSNFSKIFTGIKLLVGQRNENRMKTKICIDFVASHLNFKEIKELGDLAIDLKVDEVGVNEVQNWYIPSQEEFTEASQFVSEARKYSTTIQSHVSLLRERLKKFGIRVDSLNSSKMKVKCTWPFRGTFVTSDGYVTSCCIRMDPDANNFGNIFDHSFREIWNNEKYRWFREQLINGNSNGVCDQCPD